MLRIGTADYSLWYDELASLEFARQPVGRLWSIWMLRETNPPLYYSLLSGWIAVFGHSDVVLRLPSIGIGLAGIWAAYLLGFVSGGVRAGLLAAALLALSAAHTDLSHEVRAYSLAHTGVLFACLGITHYLRTKSTAALILYGTGTLVALYSHTTLALFAAIAATTMIWFLRADRWALLRWLAANSVVLALWGWWVAISLRQIAQPVTNIDWIQAPSIREALDMTAVAYLPMYLRAPGPFSVFLLAGLFAGVGKWVFQARRPEVTLLAVLAAGAPLLLFVISQEIPIFLPRTLSWASGPTYVLIALAVGRIPSRLIAGASTVVLLSYSAIGLAAWMPDREREQWRQSVAAMESLGSTAVLVSDDAVALAIEKYRTQTSGMVPIVVQSPKAQHERWSDGLYSGPHVSAESASRLIGLQRCAVGVGWGPFQLPALNGVSGDEAVPGTSSGSPRVSFLHLNGVKGDCKA